MMKTKWNQLNSDIISCTKCPRLRRHCLKIAKEKRRSFQNWSYWGKPIPNFGDPNARLLIHGLAPAAHGANRTGQMFTGDRSGEWLFRALYRAGFANQPNAASIQDGLVLRDCVIDAAAHCAPPDNTPTRGELQNCSEYFQRTLDLVPFRVILALGGISWKHALAELRAREWLAEKPIKFSHGALCSLTEGRWLLGSYHPSQQNTFTGRLTEEMFDSIFSKAQNLIEID